MVKAFFLDRDGIINEDYGYVYKIEDFKLKEGIINLCKKAQQNGFLLIVVTNQSGIERGYYSEDDFKKITKHMLQLFHNDGIEITDVFYCPLLNSEDRKPNPGMFYKAQKKYAIDMTLSIAIGDKETDLIAAKRAGINKLYLLSSQESKNFSQYKINNFMQIAEKEKWY